MADNENGLGVAAVALAVWLCSHRPGGGGGGNINNLTFKSLIP